MLGDLFADPQGTDEEILAATYRALVDHGYAELTIQRIGAELGKSPSLVYHHYENKDELVLACLEFMLDRFRTEMVDPEVDDPVVYLEETLDWMATAHDHPEEAAFLAVLVELRTLAIHHEDYREHFTRSDRVVREHFVEIIEAGNAEGRLAVEEPESAADTLVTALLGAIERAATTENRAWTAGARDELAAYLGLPAT